jgi:hypothetical protein
MVKDRLGARQFGVSRILGDIGRRALRGTRQRRNASSKRTGERGGSFWPSTAEPLRQLATQKGRRSRHDHRTREQLLVGVRAPWSDLPPVNDHLAWVEDVGWDTIAGTRLPARQWCAGIRRLKVSTTANARPLHRVSLTAEGANVSLFSQAVWCTRSGGPCLTVDTVRARAGFP